MRGKNRPEGGFTLVELLVVIGIISVLAALSEKSYDLYKKRSYDSVMAQIMNNTKTALEAGRISIPLGNGPGWVGVWTTSAGDMPLYSGLQYFPGLKIPDNMMVWAERADDCESGLWGAGCFTEFIWMRHCKGELSKSYWRTKDGLQGEWEWPAGWAC